MRTKPDWSSTQNLIFDKREERTARRDGELKDRTKDGVQDQTWLGIRRHGNGTATGDCATDSFSKTPSDDIRPVTHPAVFKTAKYERSTQTLRLTEYRFFSFAYISLFHAAGAIVV